MRPEGGPMALLSLGRGSPRGSSRGFARRPEPTVRGPLPRPSKGGEPRARRDDLESLGPASGVITMKRSTLAIGLMIGAAILTRPALAQRPGRGGPPGGGGPPLPVLAALDADGDGELSAKEIDNAAAALRTLDKNKDGKLTRDELLPASREGGAGGPGGSNPEELVARMMAFDKDGDGKLSKDELPERMRDLLERAD